MTSGSRTVLFAGSRWAVKASSTPVGPGPNVFSDRPENVWVDAAGRLNLRITFRAGQWRCAEVTHERSLGHGRYAFSLDSAVDRLDSHVVLGLFTWSDNPADNHREIDIEFARWGDPAAPNGQYVVQPHDRPGNVHAFAHAHAAPSTHTIAWAPDRVSFHSATATGQAIAGWTYGGPDIPGAGDERTRINLWLYGGTPPAGGAEVAVAVSAFTFTRHENSVAAADPGRQ